MSKLIEFIEIRYADPICNIELNDDEVIYGTMLGCSGYFSIKDKKLYILTESENERISGVQFLNEPNKFIVVIGDYEILQFTIDKDNPIPKGKRTKNYDSQSEHNLKCESCFNLLYKKRLLSLFLNLPPDPSKTNTFSSFKNEIKPVDFIVKNLITNDSDAGQIDLSSYIVPFDYDGIRLLFIDFISNDEKHLSIFNFRDKKKELDYIIPSNFGHISHLFFIPNKKIFLIKNYCFCEIRSENFDLIETYTNIGEEIIASSYYYDKNKDIIYIITLDINGDVFIFNDKNQDLNFMFNIYCLDYIPQLHKDRHFFSMGYPYFIRFNQNYIVITSDYGCYILKR